MAPTSKLVCFSFAAYAKTLIAQLRSLNIPIFPGLTDKEFSHIESTFHFTFPPDLRSILQEGLPIGPHFPNWRSSSPQQLQILLNLPFFNLFKNVSKYNFWVDSWGARPKNNDQALNLVKEITKDKVPALVPVYRNCYIPATCPNLSGNPVLVVDDTGVRVVSFDVARFFQEVVLDGLLDKNGKKENNNNKDVINVPVWAAKEARRVEFWTEVAERGWRRRVEEEVEEMEVGWWWDFGEYLGGCLERVYWMLRDGGWKEEEVREIMMMRNGMDGSDHRDDQMDGRDHVRLMSIVLLRAGWSREDVVYSLGFNDDDEDEDEDEEDDFDHHVVDGGNDDDGCGGGRMFLEFQPQNGYCSRDTEGGDHSTTLKHWINLQLVS